MTPTIYFHGCFHRVPGGPGLSVKVTSLLLPFCKIKRSTSDFKEVHGSQTAPFVPGKGRKNGLKKVEKNTTQVILCDLFIPKRWRSLSPLKGHLTIPKRSQRITRTVFFPGKSSLWKRTPPRKNTVSGQIIKPSSFLQSQVGKHGSTDAIKTPFADAQHFFSLPFCCPSPYQKKGTKDTRYVLFNCWEQL